MINIFSMRLEAVDLCGLADDGKLKKVPTDTMYKYEKNAKTHFPMANQCLLRDIIRYLFVYSRRWIFVIGGRKQ